MSERSSGSQGGASEPQRLRAIDELKIPRSFNEPVLPGVASSTEAREKQLPADGLLFVGMNSAAYAKVERDRVGQVYTVGLGGCTGIAGVANIRGGALAGISHFDAVVDTVWREKGVCASERFMNRFIQRARGLGSRSIKLLITYDENQKRDPRYGVYGDNYDVWHYLNQLESFVEEAERDVDVALQSYKGMGSGHTLAANVDRGSRLGIEFR